MGAHDATLTRPWGDGTHVFRLPIGQLLELQDLCKAGPVEIFDRLMSRRWRVQDLREIVRLGLIGGGMTPIEALARVERYVDGRPLVENVPVAVEIIGMALMGPAEAGDTAGGKAEAEGEVAGSPPPLSMEPEPL